MENASLEIIEQGYMAETPFFIGTLLWKNVPKDLKSSRFLGKF